ncbi:hypothetical protein VFPPC_17534 [Pochonia chlamydosporia 170]|uniref:Uncharacterized protein n=1 Tax=Pochonia chlamydosporia 170 TaxID=1380566 RepID=A0A219AR92_METCM|nr:hypothetical protein VFPPC_17534 [Pochonia chlamydosporia 170]OWT43303.1 hypothetical protein VFPPC_17534 [Pochonia chlamydosporia 170]
MTEAELPPSTFHLPPQVSGCPFRLGVVYNVTQQAPASPLLHSQKHQIALECESTPFPFCSLQSIRPGSRLFRSMRSTVPNSQKRIMPCL